MDESLSPLARGAETIRSFAKNLPETAGVYRMLGVKNDVLYVGKAKALKRRVTSYTQVERLPLRLKRMVSETVKMEFILTVTEVEALLLEQNLIKEMKPRYNILLRDDKSYPFIHISAHEFPKLGKHRGAQTQDGEYFGPFASSTAVNRTVDTLMRAFMLRNCSDNVFATRDRPCLQYHIKRCTAPCVGYISAAEYNAQVQDAHDFLSGKSDRIKQTLSTAMDAAAERLDFEKAAQLRDRIRALAAVGLQQEINLDTLGDADVLACVRDAEKGISCVQVFFFRASQNFGNKSFYPKHDADESDSDILTAFLEQFYTSHPPPPSILVNHRLDDTDLIEQALQERFALKRRPEILFPQRTDRLRAVHFAERNAREALNRHLVEKTADRVALQGVAELFQLPELPERIEVYDNSHTGGAHMMAGMIVAGRAGFRRNAYRKFNIKDASASDDFAMMREVMRRRFAHLDDGDDTPDGFSELPDLLLIDGGLGQLSSVMEILRELNLDTRIPVVAISKGPDRNAGREWFHRDGQESFQLPVDDPVLHYLQRLRDEAHRFVIGAMRVRRQKAMTGSRLDDIPGIGPKRKKALLNHFGSAKMVEGASLEDLQAVDGISTAFAQIIHDFFHG